MNRRERRKQARLHRIGLRALKLRCIGCERVGQPMSQEHLFPKWLIEYASVRKGGITWLGRKRVDPDKATIPLCRECNGALSQSLEAPLAEIFRAVDRGESLSDRDCELVVRWMWKFEGLQWHLNFFGVPQARYTESHTLVERVTTSAPFEQVRADMALAISRTKNNDKDFEDWPLGLDMPPTLSAMAMSGVFGPIAIICSLGIFADEIPEQFGIYRFGNVPDRDEKLFLPLTGFETATDAVVTTLRVSLQLAKLHDELARKQQEKPGLIMAPRRRVELPPV